MEVILSIVGATVALAGLQISVMTKVIETNSRIVRLEQQATELVYVDRQMTTVLQRLARIEQALYGKVSRTLEEENDRTHC